MTSAGSDWRRADAPIGYGRQTIDERDVEAVRAILIGDWLTQGPTVGEFETALQEATGACHAVVVANGTAALHLALLGVGIGPGDRVVTTANTFLASASAAVMCGACVDFVDVETTGWNLDPARLEARLSQKPTVHAVVAVHYAGRACDLDALLALKARFGFRLIIDACHALGGTADVAGAQRRVGEVGGVDATVLSFHPVKQITTGEGGAILTDDRACAERLRRLREHGLSRDTDVVPFEGEHSIPPWFAAMEELGYNYRLTDMAAALGLAQLERLDEFVAARRDRAARYDDLLSPSGYPERPELASGHAWHLYPVHVAAGERDELMAWLREGGIGTQLHYYPVPLQPYFRGEYTEQDFPNAVRHARTSLSLPLYPALTAADQDRVAAALAEWGGAR